MSIVDAVSSDHIHVLMNQFVFGSDTLILFLLLSPLKHFHLFLGSHLNLCKMSISVIHRLSWYSRVHTHLRGWLWQTCHTPCWHMSVLHLLLLLLLKLLYLLRLLMLWWQASSSMIILGLIKVHGEGDQVVMAMVLRLILIKVLIFLEKHLCCR